VLLYQEDAGLTTFSLTTDNTVASAASGSTFVKGRALQTGIERNFGANQVVRGFLVVAVVMVV